jgi:hypothetical protein
MVREVASLTDKEQDLNYANNQPVNVSIVCLACRG